MISFLKLFKSILIDNPNKPLVVLPETLDKLKKSINRGVLIDPRISEINSFDQYHIFNQIENLYGIDKIDLNSTMFPSWALLAHIDLDLYIYHQSIQYNQIYGDNPLNLDKTYTFSQDSPEKQRLLDESFKVFTVIKAVTKTELTKMVNSLLSSSLAIDSNTLIELINDCATYNIQIDVKSIKNKEVIAILISKGLMQPQSAEQLIRSIMFIASDKTSIQIKKSKDQLSLIREITSIQESEIKTLVINFIKSFGEIKLAESAKRYKPIYMALRYIKELRPYINRIWKLSKKHGVPMKKDPLSYATSLSNDEFNTPFNLNLIKNKGNFQIIRAINALSLLEQRYGHQRLVTYRPFGLRYSKLKTFKPKNLSISEIRIRKEQLELYLISNLKEKFKDSNVFIKLPPTNQIDLTIPTSGKDMLGHMPMYTKVKSNPNTESTIVGITWNQEADLDLHASSRYGNIGWNQNFRLDDVSVMFSGDMTALNKHGVATEMIKIGHITNQFCPITFSTLLFNTNMNKNGIDFTMFISQEQKDKDLMSEAIKNTDNPMTLMSNVVLVNKSVAKYETTSIGMLINNDFIFVNDSINSKKTQIPDDDFVTLLTKDINDKAKSSLKLDLKFIDKLAFNQITDNYINSPNDIILDFSLDSLSFDSFVQLLSLS